jgi:hypothetical protein
MDLLCGILTPMFAGGAAGDIILPRRNATNTVAAYQARNHAELLKICQIVAFGMAVMEVLRLAATSQVSPSLKLRLFAGADALGRSARQHEKALQQGRRPGLREARAANGRPVRPMSHRSIWRRW